ncbi:MAG TPA: right-handed parallel beta-helix repeat-containing protein [Verrucomicrobiae bacterium]|nr:right-handed parallel beta-helix repeat-containing protein [Verrucomicrobiae bacterium]
MKRILISALLLVGLVSHGATRYVSVTGSAGNSGLIASSPWPLSYALAHVTPNSTLILLSGNYPSIDLSAQNQQGLTLRSQIKLGARIVGTAGLQGIATESAAVLSNIVVDGFEVVTSAIDGVKFTGPFCSVSNCWIHNCFGQGVAAHNVNRTRILWNLIEHNGTDQQHDHGIYVAGTNLDIGCNVIRYNRHYGVQCYDSTGDVADVHLFNNLIYGNPLGVILWSYGGYTNSLIGNTIVSAANNAVVLNGGVCTITNNILFCGSSYYPIELNHGAVARTDYNLVSKRIAPSGAHDVQSASAGFVNAAKGLYWLTSGSPARGMAASAAHATTSFFGQTQGTVTDVGAFQYNPLLAADARTLDPLPNDGSDYWLMLTSDGNRR